MKKTIFFILSIFILTSCGEKKTESSESAVAKQKSQQLIPTSLDSITILQAKMINSFMSPYDYKWGASYNYIIFQPIKSYKGQFNNDQFVIDFETHWKMDSIHGQIPTDTLPFIKNKEYVLSLNLMKPDSGDYFNNEHIMYLYKLDKFIDAESKDKDDMIKQWVGDKH